MYKDFHVLSQLRERAIRLIQLNSLPKFYEGPTENRLGELGSLYKYYYYYYKNVYGNFHVTLWTKAADNLDHQVSIEISIHLLKQRICIIHFLPKESIEISMRCLNFFWTKFTDILYRRGV